MEKVFRVGGRNRVFFTFFIRFCTNIIGDGIKRLSWFIFEKKFIFVKSRQFFYVCGRIHRYPRSGRRAGGPPARQGKKYGGWAARRERAHTRTRGSRRVLSTTAAAVVSSHSPPPHSAHDFPPTGRCLPATAARPDRESPFQSTATGT